MRALKEQNLLDAANAVLTHFMPSFPDSRAVDDCLVALAAAVADSERDSQPRSVTSKENFTSRVAAILNEYAGTDQSDWTKGDRQILDFARMADEVIAKLGGGHETKSDAETLRFEMRQIAADIRAIAISCHDGPFSVRLGWADRLERIAGPAMKSESRRPSIDKQP